MTSNRFSGLCWSECVCSGTQKQPQCQIQPKQWPRNKPVLSGTEMGPECLLLSPIPLTCLFSCSVCSSRSVQECSMQRWSDLSDTSAPRLSFDYRPLQRPSANPASTVLSNSRYWKQIPDCVATTRAFTQLYCILGFEDDSCVAVLGVVCESSASVIQGPGPRKMRRSKEFQQQFL